MKDDLENILDQIQRLINKYEEISGLWNGDDSTALEDIAREANDNANHLLKARQHILNALKEYH